ncbi:Pentatricopeptide repeat [Macleaya cordata]|uniref:Pentatricopeptide repeat n=1 Tax=Macleaya cordata TaxID=56857 RepID=A0A200QCL3_MACCD|nr:Pentatricopeptide repeat [Macleaya cordata]
MLNGSLRLPSRHFFQSRFTSTLSLSHHRNQIDSHQFSYYVNPLDSFDIFLQQCTSHQQLKQIHTQIILTGTNQSGFLSARLISIYTRFGFLDHARKAFESIPIDCKSNLLLWNSILRANLSHGYPEETLKLYFQMQNQGVSPDGFTFPLVIRACSSMGNSELCKTVHSHVVVLGFQFHLHVGNELIGLYGKIGYMDYAMKVFDKMPQRSYISWNSMISGFAQNFDCDGAVKMFGWMESEGLEPNLVTWTSYLSAHKRCGRHEEVMGLFREMRVRKNGATAEAVSVVLSACADLDAFQMGKVIHGYVINGGFQDYMVVKNSLICVYGGHGNTKEARMLFSEIAIKNLVSWNAFISSFANAGLCDEAHEALLRLENSDTKMRPNVISYSAVIGGFSSKGRGNECLEVFRKMLHLRVCPNSITIISVLSLCAELVALGLGREIHGYSIRSLMDKNISVGNGLVNMYTKCGSLKEGRSVFDRMGAKDLISWNSMIEGYGKHGYGDDAVITFDEMVKSRLKPDHVTFVAVLFACSHAGLVTEGRRLFDQMISEFMLPPLMEHYSCMVDLLGRAGLLQEASELVKEMPFEPNECVWGALLNSCRMYKNTEVAEDTASQIFSLQSEITGSYMLLSNLYAACGRWEDSAKVRLSAKTKGLKKIPGQSWIEVKKKVYMFSAGNHGQLCLEEVYGLLEDWRLPMEAEGYIPDKSFVLQDVGEEEKKQILNGHSEKLAIVFGHANIPINFPLRVVKNLRVCGDCHNWTKIFSKLTKREVIVRDGRRFHHFKDGLCSCKDYW